MILIKNTQDVPKKVYSLFLSKILKKNGQMTNYLKSTILIKEVDFINTLIKPMND